MCYRVPDHVYHRTLHDEVALLDTRADAYLGLNCTAAAVWGVVSAGHTPATAADALVASFDVSLEIARADVSAVIDTLVARGLLEPTTS